MGSLVCLQFMTWLLLCLHVFTLHHFTAAHNLFLHDVTCTHICLPVVRAVVHTGNHPNEHIDMSHTGYSLQFSCVSLVDTSIDSCGVVC